MKQKMTLEDQADVAIISAAKILLKRRDDEIAKLRAALEEIAALGSGYGTKSAGIARKALAGGGNEQSSLSPH
jgi:hypothetical protein